MCAANGTKDVVQRRGLIGYGAADGCRGFCSCSFCRSNCGTFQSSSVRSVSALYAVGK